MKLLHLTILALASTTSAAPVLGTLLGGLSGVLNPVVNGVGTLLGAPGRPNQTGTVLTLPVLSGTGYSKPNSCRCKAVGSFCGYRAYEGVGASGEKPLVAEPGGSCDPTAVYTCNQINSFGSSATCVLCLASFEGLAGTEIKGKDTCAIRLAGTGN